jgi:hypothetical protein
MKKKYWQLLLIFAMAILFVFPLSLYPISASASIFTSDENEKYAMWINDLSFELTDYEIHVDLWHFSVAGRYAVTLNNSGDTDILLRWNDGNGVHKGNEMIIPAKTVKKYSVNFYFNLLSRDFSYEYKEI